MAYEVIVNGIPVRADTAADAMQLAELIAAKQQGLQPVPTVSQLEAALKAETKNGATPKADGAAAWAVFAKLVATEPQRRILRTLKEKGEIAKNDIATVACVERNSVAGVLRMLVMNAEKAGLTSQDVYYKETQGSGKERQVRYMAGSMLVANEI